MAPQRTLEQIEMELYNAKRHRDRARETIEQRLEQIASMRVMHAHYVQTLDKLLDERNALPTRNDVEEAA